MRWRRIRFTQKSNATSSFWPGLDEDIGVNDTAKPAGPADKAGMSFVIALRSLVWLLMWVGNTRTGKFRQPRLSAANWVFSCSLFPLFTAFSTIMSGVMGVRAGFDILGCARVGAQNGNHREKVLGIDLR